MSKEQLAGLVEEWRDSITPGATDPFDAGENYALTRCYTDLAAILATLPEPGGVSDEAVTAAIAVHGGAVLSQPTEEKMRAYLEAALPYLAPAAGSTHCDNCGCDWLDNGLNPVGCPYCKAAPAGEVDDTVFILGNVVFADDWFARFMVEGVTFLAPLEDKEKAQYVLSAKKRRPQPAPAAQGFDAELSDEDVYTLMGDAELRRGRGEADMPDYLLDLAGKIARSIGNRHLAERVADIAAAAKGVDRG